MVNSVIIALNMLNASRGVHPTPRKSEGLAECEIRHSCIESYNETWAVKMKQNIQVLHGSGFTGFCWVGFLAAWVAQHQIGLMEVGTVTLRSSQVFSNLANSKNVCGACHLNIFFKLTLLGRLAMFILPAIWQARRPMFNAWLWSTRGKSRQPMDVMTGKQGKKQG